MCLFLILSVFYVFDEFISDDVCLCPMRPCLAMSVVCFGLHLDVFRQALLHRHGHPPPPPPSSPPLLNQPLLLPTLAFFLIFPPDNQTDHQDFPPAGDQTILFIGALSLYFFLFRDDLVTSATSITFFTCSHTNL